MLVLINLWPEVSSLSWVWHWQGLGTQMDANCADTGRDPLAGPWWKRLCKVLGAIDGSLRSRRGDQLEGLGETLTGMGAGCVSLGILQLHSPLTTLSILFQNKVLTVDGVKVKLQVCPHVPGSISLAALGVQRWTKPLRGQSRGAPPQWGPTSILCGCVSCPGAALWTLLAALCPWQEPAQGWGLFWAQ